MRQEDEDEVIPPSMNIWDLGTMPVSDELEDFDHDSDDRFEEFDFDEVEQFDLLKHLFEVFNVVQEDPWERLLLEQGDFYEMCKLRHHTYKWLQEVWCRETSFRSRPFGIKSELSSGRFLVHGHEM